MQSFHIVKSTEGLVRLAQKILRNSQYDGHPNLTEQQRPALVNGPILIYVYVDIQSAFGRDVVNYKPVLCYRTLERRIARRLVYFRTEKEGPVTTTNQLILSPGGFTAFVAKLKENLIMALSARDRRVLEHATMLFDRHMAKMETIFNKWHRLQFATLRRTFEYLDNGTAIYTSIPYPIYLSPDIANNYIYARKGNTLSTRPQINKKPDIFQNYVRPMFELDLAKPHKTKEMGRWR